MSIDRVGGLAIVVGHVLAVAVGAGCTGPSRPAAATAVALEVPPMGGASGAEVGDSDSTARFGHPPAAIGSSYRVETTAVSTSASAADEQVTSYTSSFRVTVLDVEGPAATKVRLHFDKNETLYQAQATQHAIHGKEYVLESRAPHVHEASGAVAPEDESERVLDSFPDIGTRTRIDEMLPRSMRIGERRDDLATVVVRILHPRAWSLTSGTASLVRLDGGDAVFVVELAASSASNMTISVKGELRVRMRDSRLSSLSLDGTYEPRKGDAGGATGAGEEHERAFRYRRVLTDAP